MSEQDKMHDIKVLTTYINMLAMEISSKQAQLRKAVGDNNVDDMKRLIRVLEFMFKDIEQAKERLVILQRGGR